MGKKKKISVLKNEKPATKKVEDKIVLNMSFAEAIKKALTTPLPNKIKH